MSTTEELREQVRARYAQAATAVRLIRRSTSAGVSRSYQGGSTVTASPPSGRG